MPKRYLNDENNVPLKAWREGEYMVVESVGPVHWKHQWTGLDPRRYVSRRGLSNHHTTRIDYKLLHVWRIGNNPPVCTFCPALHYPPPVVQCNARSRAD